MTERSWLWDGTTTGDASYAPYDRAKFNKWFVAAHHCDTITRVHTVPGYLEDLKVSANSLGTLSQIVVSPGAAIVGNFVYVLDEEISFDIDLVEEANYYRHDYLVLRIDYKNNTVRLALVKGLDESATFGTLPDINRDEDGLWDVILARVCASSSGWVISGKDLRTFKEFIPTYQYRNDLPEQMVGNSEFMAFSALQTVSTEAPEKWKKKGSPTFASAAQLYPLQRGRSVRITANENEGMYQELFNAIPETVFGTVGSQIIEPYPTRTFTLEGLIEIGTINQPVAIELIAYDQNEQALDDTLLISVYEQFNLGTGYEWIEYVRVKDTITFSEDIYKLELHVYSTYDSSNTFDVSQILVSPGYFTGGFRKIEELIMFDYALTDALWDGTPFYNTAATYDYDLTTTWGSLILPYTKGVLIHTWMRGSASSGATNVATQIISRPDLIVRGEVQVEGMINLGDCGLQIFVPTDKDFTRALSTTTVPIRITRVGVGGNIAVYVELIGIQT